LSTAFSGGALNAVALAEGVLDTKGGIEVVSVRAELLASAD
jgi:hypothetical protein